MKVFTILNIFLFSPLSFADSETFERIEVKGSKSDFFNIASSAQESLTKKEIEERNLFHGEELWNQFSNFSTASGSNRIRYFKIRGIGERSEYDTIPSNSVGVFYDHIDLSGLIGILALYDADQVKVLKGPQTFLYGDSSLGGNVLFTSTDPSEDKKSVWSDVGSQNHRTVGAQVNVPISDMISVKTGIQKSVSDGFYYNPYFQEHTSGRDELFANLGWQIEKGSTLIKFSHIYGEYKNGNDLWNTDNSFHVYSDKKGHDDQLTHGHSLEWTGPLAQNTQYLMIGSYSLSDQLISYDEDWNNNSYWLTVPNWNKNYDYFKSYQRRKANLHLKPLLQHQWNQWDVSYGIHYYQKWENTDVNSYRNSNLQNSLIADYRADKAAFLANVNYRPSESNHFNLSLRVEQQDIQYKDTHLNKYYKKNRPVAFNFFYNFSQGAHTWQWLVGSGFKGAGFNPDINLNREQQEYDPEYATNYEFAWKYQKSQLKNSLSLFYMDRRHHQITTSSQDDPSDPSKFTFYVDNAARSHHYGLEWQGEWTPVSILSLFASVGLLRAEFVDYQFQNQCYRGRALAHSPKYTFSLTSIVSMTSWLKLTLNSIGRDGFYYSNSYDGTARANILLNSSLDWTVNSNLQVSLWGKNLFNKRYSQRAFYFGNEPPNFEAHLYEQNANPLEWGLRAKYQF